MNNDFKFISKPVAILLFIVILFSILVTVGVKKINEIRVQIAESVQLENLLSNKVTILESLPNVLAGDTTFLDIALPSRGAVLFGLSQIKNQAFTNGIIISNLKTSSIVPIKNEISKISISFDIDGTEDSVYKFLNSFSKTLPLMSIDKVKLDKSLLGIRSSVSISVYTAELPTKIKAITGKTTELTDEDIQTITEISRYTIPSFVEPKPSQIEAKIDPFN